MNTDFYNDRRPNPRNDGDDARGLDRMNLRAANRQLLESAPDYNREVVQTRIRTTAVQRHRWRGRGQDDFASISEYKNFILGTDD